MYCLNDDFPSPNVNQWEKMIHEFNPYATPFHPRSSSSMSSESGYSEGDDVINESLVHSDPPAPLDPPTQGFVFNLGVVNAPGPGFRTVQREMDDGTIVVSVDESTPVRNKIKEFSIEELEKQKTITKEMKEKFEKSLDK
uniref:RBM17 n=1 Tax=Caenorhabditis tropicalis TaxID=1561998 RepID=A0A1I7UTC5_9PELO